MAVSWRHHEWGKHTKHTQNTCGRIRPAAHQRGGRPRPASRSAARAKRRREGESQTTGATRARKAMNTALCRRGAAQKKRQPIEGRLEERGGSRTGRRAGARVAGGGLGWARRVTSGGAAAHAWRAPPRRTTACRSAERAAVAAEGPLAAAGLIAAAASGRAGRPRHSSLSSRTPLACGSLRGARRGAGGARQGVSNTLCAAACCRAVAPAGCKAAGAPRRQLV